MGRIDELIAELYPNGVEYRKLGDFASISRGGNFQKKDFAEVGTPCIHYGQIYTRYGLFANTTISFITDEAASKSRFASQNDIVMAVTSENVVDVCKCVAWLGSDDIAISGHTAIIKHNQNPKYLTYYFHSSMFFTQKVKIANGTKVIEVSPNKLNDILIPIPPLAIQEEIVRILDNFTELSAELSARKKQYEYYQKQLLPKKEVYRTFDLGEIADISVGSKPSVIFEHETEYEYINAGTSNSGYSNSYNSPGDTVTTPSRGQGGIGYIGFQPNPFWLGPLCYKIKSKNVDLVLTKYLSWIIQQFRLFLFKPLKFNDLIQYQLSPTG